ncbi:ParA family protein, partial [Streptomyces sp. IB201691-2A2]|uniref:ParA family protein n=1 Tax=Streptomyces sp. IB201691-2A2 TaxID=2561920 RepID=UPI001CA5FF04
MAVTADAGGTGGTTVALGVAAGLARRGLNTAVIMEPGTLEGQLNEHIADTKDGWAVLACPAPGRLEAAARQTTTLLQQLRAAQERADVVVIDPTGSACGVSLPVDPDVTLAIPPEKSVWGAWLWIEHQKLDHRPPKVRMAAWLSERFERFTWRYQQAHPPAPSEVLLHLLDERFLLVASDRTSETTGEYADLYTDVAADPEDLKE